MGRTVGELLDTLDAAELHDWMAVYSSDPWGEDRADLRAGIIAATIAWGNGAKGAKPADFMPSFGEPPEPEVKSDEQLLAMAKKLNAMMGGTVKARTP